MLVYGIVFTPMTNNLHQRTQLFIFVETDELKLALVLIICHWCKDNSIPIAEYFASLVIIAKMVALI